MNYWLVGVIAVFSLVWSVSGQEDSSASAQPMVTTFSQIEKDYFFQLEKNREAQEVFNLDRAEYYKLGTLASKEKAVISLKNFMITRPLVLEVYLSGLDSLLRPAQGIEVAQKQIALDQIQEVKVILSQHRDRIPSVAEKEEVLAESAVLENQLQLITEAQYRPLSLLAIGRVQRAFDQLIIHTEEFKNVYVEAVPDSSKKASLVRGLKDVDAQNQAAKKALSEAMKTFNLLNPTEKDKRPNAQGIYSQVINDLQPAYSAMKKSITFLSELETRI